MGSDTNQDTWNQLSKAIREIQNHNASHLSFEENYRFAYNMVLYKQGTVLYEGVKKLVTENLDKLAKDVIVPTFPVVGENDSVQDGQEGERLLKAFRSVWDDHTSSMAKLRDLLKYMVRVQSEDICSGLNNSLYTVGSCIRADRKSPANMGCWSTTFY